MRAKSDDGGGSWSHVRRQQKSMGQTQFSPQVQKYKLITALTVVLRIFIFKLVFPRKLTALYWINLDPGVDHYKITSRLRCSMDETRFSLRMKGTLSTSGAV